MDKEQLAKKLYTERIFDLLGDQSVDEGLIEQLWEEKTSPQEAVKSILEPSFDGAPWLTRYLNRK